jgi:hypothetical protein
MYEASEFFEQYEAAINFSITDEARERIEKKGVPTWVGRFLDATHYELAFHEGLEVTLSASKTGLFVLIQTRTGTVLAEVRGVKSDVFIYYKGKAEKITKTQLLYAQDIMDTTLKCVREASKSVSDKDEVRPGLVEFSCFTEGVLVLPEKKHCAPQSGGIMRYRIEVSAESLIGGMVIAIEKMKNLKWVLELRDIHEITCESLAWRITHWVTNLRGGLTSVKVSIRPDRGVDPRGVSVSWAPRVD